MASSRISYESAQYRHHRARRSRQDHARRPAVPPVRHLPRQPARRGAGDGFERPGEGARDHDSRQADLGRLDPAGRDRERAHQHRRYARPRRFRRRGGADPVDGRRRRPAGRFVRRRDAADQVRHRQGAGAGAATDRRGQQGRPQRRAHPGSAGRGVRPVRQPGGDRRTARLPGALRLGPQRLRLDRHGRARGHADSDVRDDRRARAAAQRGSRTGRSSSWSRCSTATISSGAS